MLNIREGSFFAGAVFACAGHGVNCKNCDGKKLQKQMAAGTKPQNMCDVGVLRLVWGPCPHFNDVTGFF